jgi:hypothetical protein
VNLKKRGFWACPALKKGGSGYPLYPVSPITIGVPGCRFYPSRGASRSKQGTKIEELGFWGKENENSEQLGLKASKIIQVIIETKILYERGKFNSEKLKF